MSSSAGLTDVNEMQRNIHAQNNKINFRALQDRTLQPQHQGRTLRAQNEALERSRFQRPDQIPVDDLPNSTIIAPRSTPRSLDELPDMTIRCRDQEFKAHCSVVCSQSSVFRKAVDARRGAEAATPSHVVVSLAAEQPEIVERFLQFLDGGYYNDLRTPVRGVMQPHHYPLYTVQPTRELLVREGLFLSLHLYLMANKYDVPALKVFARGRFHHDAAPEWRNLPYFVEAIDVLYSDKSEGHLDMRETVCSLVASGIHEVGQSARMADVMGKHGEFAFGVLKHVLEGEKDGRAIGKKTVTEPVGKRVHLTIP